MTALDPQLLGDAAGQQAAERLALLFSIDDGLVEHAEPIQGLGSPGRSVLSQLEEQGLDLGPDRLGRGPADGGDRFDRSPLGHIAQQLLVGIAETGFGDRTHEGINDDRVERGADPRGR